METTTKQYTGEYSSKDLGEACSLITLGCPLRNIIWKDNVGYFLFSDRPTCEKLQQDYYFGTLTVPARAFYDNLRMLKRRLYQHERPRT